VKAYSVEVAPKAEAQIKALPKAEAKRIVARLGHLASDPRPPKSEQLSGSPPFRRIRVGDYRVIYTIDEAAKTVIIARVRHRKDAYRDLERLDLAAIMNTIRRRRGSTS
jgi:mRNA interferase RelE/StbE